MKKILKLAVVFIVVVFSIAAVTSLYWQRDQEIAFEKILPKEFTRCGISINQFDSEYIELSNWFKYNQDKWNNTPVTYVQNNYYSSPIMTVSILKNAVVVNYEDTGGTWKQVIRNKSNYDLKRGCARTKARTMFHELNGTCNYPILDEFVSNPEFLCKIDSLKRRCNKIDDCYVYCYSNAVGEQIGGGCAHLCNYGLKEEWSPPADFKSCKKS